MREVRCSKCNKLLCKIDLKHKAIEPCQEGEITCKYISPMAYFGVEIKCPRCGTMNTNKKESVE